MDAAGAKCDTFKKDMLSGFNKKCITGGRATDVREDRVEVLLYQEAEGADHGDAGVGKLGLAQHEDLLVRLVLEKAKRVEEAKGRRHARERLGKSTAGGRGDGVGRDGGLSLHLQPQLGDSRSHGASEGERLGAEGEHVFC